MFIFLNIQGCLTAPRANEDFLSSDKVPNKTSAYRPTGDSPWSLSKRQFSYIHVWPDLQINWRVALGTAIGFVGGCLGSVGGVGGGGIYVPMLILIIGFDQKSSAALSKCMVMGASAATVFYNFQATSRTIDYDLALIFQPMLMLGISIGVTCNVIFPNWLVTIFLLVIFTGTSLKTFLNAISLWKKETFEKMLAEHGALDGMSPEIGLENEQYKVLEPVEDDASKPLCSNMNWKGLAVLFFVWISFLILQILKNKSATCSSLFWIYNILQVPVAVAVFLNKAVSLYRRNKEGECFTCSPKVHWTISMLALCSLSGLLAGFVGGLLGLGGGFILGPLFVELGVPPQVSSATATFVMLFSSSMSVIEYHLLHRFPVLFGIYLFAVNVAAGLVSQYFLQKIVMLLGRASVIIFIVCFVVFASGICLGGYGIEEIIISLQNRYYMGFSSICTD